jgi:hypothetical protein
MDNPPMSDYTLPRSAGERLALIQGYLDPHTIRLLCDPQVDIDGPAWGTRPVAQLG